MANEPEYDQTSAGVSAAATAMIRKRLEAMGPEGRKKLAAHAGKASWANLSPEARRLEMARRLMVRRRNRLKKAKALRTKGAK